MRSESEREEVGDFPGNRVEDRFKNPIEAALGRNMASGGSGPAGSLPSSSGCPPPSGTRSRSRPAIVSAGSGTDSKANVEAFTQAVKKWEEQKANTSLSAFDPTELLNDMADLLEKETDTYLSKDPDPFMDRHPSRIDPDCPFGQLLKAFFRKEALVEEVFNDYTRDNYWSRLGQVLDLKNFVVFRTSF